MSLDTESLGYPFKQDVSLLPALRAMAECFQAFERVSARHIEAMGLTPSQFDALAVLGDTPGMTCKELGSRALISGGTLTPVLDRMEGKGLTTRSKSEADSRQTIVSLTEAGQALYEATFLPHVKLMRGYLDVLDEAEQTQLVSLLGKLKGALASPVT